MMCGVALALLMGGCPKPVKPPEPPQPTQGGPVAGAEIEGRSGSAMTGKVTFEQRENRVHVTLQVAGAPPGEHGVHIHETGDCSDPAAKSAGGHFNPLGAMHGGPQAAQRHPGDFGNLTVKEDGTGTLELDTDVLTVPEGAMSVVGKAIIVHEKPDDLVTQPTGNAGGRIGCGVIKAQSPTPPTPPSQPATP